MKKALIIDDSAFMRQVVKKTLIGSGYEIVEAENGKEALEILKTDTSFLLIISDVNMPVMDGLSMLEESRNIANVSSIPVIMLTTESLDELKQRGEELGVSDWLVKPFQPDQLIEAVEKVVAGS